jgi:hypothetical protein
MNEIGKAIPWVAFWLVVALYIWIEHKMYLAGHSTLLFEHKTPEEKRLREAAIRKAEIEAGVEKK